MNAYQYVDILENHLLSSMEACGIPEQDLIFQQNNHPKHTSKMAKILMKDNGITQMDLPPQSLDLNPIKHLC